ncbi:microcephalin-like isoform X1 [Ruditapes philippinarum]|uniref:microcephalin-like isoform X1 n=2 Tax=Ruditapes philippinarum TaxID=129788 RepID=UPI00295B0EEA|nr:microcephalin-like isoform X1 [Ruditapes philippinarum]
MNKMEGSESDILNENVDSDGDLPDTQIVDDRVLKDVVAYVEVMSKNDNCSGAVMKVLQQLGATVTKKFTSDVTHVVFKEGSNRTRTKAQKKGIHLVSVLWVENCKINQEHVSERMFPAIVPNLKGKPLLMTKLRKAKSMQPRDFEEELARSGERMRRKKKKLDAINRLVTTTTPLSSPGGLILVQDTQPRSPQDEGFVFTPVRLTIPDTPPSMRERMRKIKLAKEGGAESTTGGDDGDNDDVDDEKHLHLKQLQKNLFKSMVSSGNRSGTDESPHGTTSVFMSDSDDANVEEEDPFIVTEKDKTNKSLKHDTSVDSESSVNNDIIKIAQNINATLASQLDRKGSGSCVFGLDSDENLLSSQEIQAVINLPVKLKQVVHDATSALNSVEIIKKPSSTGACSSSSGVDKKTNPKQKNDITDEENLTVTKTKVGKKTMKKKLLSLTDLTEQHSVLVEPTKFSTEDRPQLEPAKRKRGRKKKADHVERASASNNDSSNTSNEVVNEEQSNENDEGSRTKDNVVNKRSRKRTSGEGLEKDVKCTVGRKKRSSVAAVTGQSKSKRGKKTLVDETCIDVASDKTDKENAGHSPVTKLQDVTTQLNLTKDNGLVCSIRETTLSLSMSTAYTDSNMPSFLVSQRRSIDEFNNSQRNNKKRRVRDRSVLTSISEQENCGDSSSNDSNRCVNSSKRHGDINMSQHRKIVRPSLVMTSLHSYEQDVVISVVKKLGGFVITDNVNETTTHVICGESRRTLNVLYGHARGIWLLSKEWVLSSLEAGKWIPEQEFECIDIFPFCKVARLDCGNSLDPYSRQSLFKGIGRVYISGRCQPPRQHLVQLLKLCGGQVIGVKERASVYIGSDYHPGMTCVETKWLLDCIMGHKLLPMDTYYLDRPKRESSPVY